MLATQTCPQSANETDGLLAFASWLQAQIVDFIKAAEFALFFTCTFPAALAMRNVRSLASTASQPLPNPWSLPGARMSTPSPTPPSRLREFFGSVPLVTLCLLFLCLGVFLLDSVVFDFGESLAASSMSPATVAGDLELYRVVTAAFTHGSMIHVGMNMVSFVSLGSSLEVLFGSLGFAFLISVYTLLVGAGFVGLGAIAATVDRAYWWQSAVGFSGVIFALAVDECALSPSPTRSVFGLFSVPTRFYPWVLMAALQFLLPNISFIGHLAGVLVGLLHCSGALHVCVPTPATLRKIETTWLPAALVRLAPYKLAPNAEPVVVQSLVPECALTMGRTCFARATGVAHAIAAAASPIVAIIRGAGASAYTAASANAGGGAGSGAHTPQTQTQTPSFGSGRLGEGNAAANLYTASASAPVLLHAGGARDIDDDDEHAGASLLQNSVSRSSSTCDIAITGEAEAAVMAARFHARGKAAAAAEARAATAAGAGRPEARAAAAAAGLGLLGLGSINS